MAAHDNTPEEIEELVVEMFDIFDGRAAYSVKDDELQRRYDADTVGVKHPLP